MNVRALLLLLALPSLLQPASCLGHGDVPPRIHNKTNEINADPSNAKLYRQRGGLLRRYRDWSAALRDFQQATILEPAESSARFYTAEMLSKLKRYAEAESALAPYVQDHPDSKRALLLRAYLHAVQGRIDRADAIFETVAASLPQPTTDFYVTWMDTLVAGGSDQIPHALERARIGLDHLGPVPGIQLKIVELEEAQGNYDNALNGLEQLLAGSSHPAGWLLRKGQLLNKAGRTDEAAHAFRAALRAWERRPAWARETAEARKLQQRIRKELP